jgi:hypothetical protein
MKNSDSLKNKLEIIDTFIGSTTDELKILEENIKKIEGFSFGAKDLADKFKGHVKKTQSEIIDLLNEQKITQPIANLLNSSLLGSLKFVKEGAIEADRIFYVRQGEILGIKTRIKKLVSLDSLTKEELIKAEQQENILTEVAVLSEEFSEIENSFNDEIKEAESLHGTYEDDQSVVVEFPEEPTEDVKVRPDKNSKTKIGRAAIDLAERRKKASRLTDNDTQMTSDKVSKKRHRKTGV